MADGGSGEKTEEPTPERLRKLRKEGNVPKSQDVVMAASFMGTFVVLAGVMPFMGEQMTGLFNVSLLAIQRLGEEGELYATALLMEGLIAFGKSIAPTMAVALIIGVSGNIAQVGFMFTLKPIMPNLQKLNPIQGIKGLVNMKKVIELLKTIIKFVLISYLSYSALKDALRDVVLIIRSELTVGMKVIGSIIWDFCIQIGGVFVGLAAFDAFYQRKRYMKDNMMSKYDVKQEYKQSEGDPQQKADRKSMHRELLNSSGAAAVKKADVVVRNPEHIAVALQYDKEDPDGGSPKIVAKGERIWAEKILDAARQYGVPVVRNVPLAQALNKLEVGEDIPEELYEAVAEVLNFVYELSEKHKKKK